MKYFLDENFNVKDTTEKVIRWIKDWFETNGPDCNAVIGISGGKDSAIAAALCVEALGKDRVIGVLLPNGRQEDICDAYAICDYLGIERYVLNINEGVRATYTQLKQNGINPSRQTIDNIPPRLRTTYIRAICQSVNGRMINTCNYSENYLGYFTVGGDGDGDMSPLGGLTASAVVAIGTELGLPTHLIEKTPADGLCGKTDEDNFGFTYKVLDKYLITEICEDISTLREIEKRHLSNAFKLKEMDTFTL